ncbi:putative ribonuclease h protein, partial [Nicotiana attenuata]
PTQKRYKLNVDGSCCGNPGKGEMGGIIRKGNGEWVLGYNMGISHATNIYMETLALLHGLKLAIENNYLPLTIETDCKELINLIHNKNCALNLIDDCRCLLSRAGDPPLQHVYREANRAADLIAKNGSSLTTFGSLTTYLIPPTFVISILERDKLGTTCPRTVPNCNALCNDS